jgi:hypothetical protein
LASEGRSGKPSRDRRQTRSQKSLGTKDPKEAKALLPPALAELEAQWATLRKGPTMISEREAHEIGETFHDRFIARHIENPSRHNWSRFVNDDYRKLDLKRINPFDMNLALCIREVSAYLKGQGLGGR